MLKKLTKYKKGFTLIELLVVIAIIGLLATIVMVSLNSARGKGAIAAIKGNLQTIRTQAEMVYDTDGDYDDVCTNSIVAGAMSSANNANGGKVDADCNDSVSAWAVDIQLNDDTYWCVDSAGSNKASDKGVDATAC